MNEMTCNVTIDVDNNIIKLHNLETKDVEINYSGDVNFTHLISILTEKIDETQKINFSIDDEIDDEKLVLILDTLKSIFTSYNEVAEEETESDETPSFITDELP